VVPHWSTAGDFTRVIGAEVGAWAHALPSAANSAAVVAGALDGECVIEYRRGAMLVGVVGVGMRSTVIGLRGRIGLSD